MARPVHRLSARRAKTERKPGLHADGAGLYLHVSKAGARSWIYRFMLRGVSRDMGLGSVATVSLAEARNKAHDARKLVKAGIDPIVERDREKASLAAEAAKTMTFKECAKALIASKKAGWRNPKHRQQWANTLEAYAYPTLGKVAVEAIDTGMVVKVLQPIWTTKPETASRLRGRIEAVLSWATVHRHREGPNPARWRGHLDQILPARSKVRAVRHHVALPYDEIAAFMARLRQQTSVGALGLEFLILTAARTGEVIGATWDEIDLGKKIWTVPAARMKGGKEHRIPLSPAAVAVLRKAKELRASEYMFPGMGKEKPLSDMAFLALLRRMKVDVTAHGFRSTFRDWAAERTGYPREVAEAALAHIVGSKVEIAYQRGDLFDKRRRLMDDWAAFCAMPPASGKIVAMRSASVENVAS